MICLNGAAARCVSVGDKIIIMAYAQYEEQEAKEHKPRVVFVDDKNQVVRVTNYEKHGRLEDMQFHQGRTVKYVPLKLSIHL